MNIAIIGCGYVGSAVARYLKDRGYTITATTTTKERVSVLQKVAHRVVVARGDDEISLRTALKNQDAVLLSVAPTSNEQVDSNGYATTYLYTAKNLVAVLQELPQIKHLIYTSSCSVYGNTNGEWVNEDSELAPASQQAQVLYETEQILLQEKSKLRVCIFRLGAIYGLGRMPSKHSNLCGTTLPGTGENFTNWSHLDDIAAGIGFALQNQLDGIYNLVNDKPVLRREILDQICEINELSKVSWEPSKFTHQGNNVRVSNQKLKASGYKLIHSEIQISSL